MRHAVLGLDIGGANLKAAHSSGDAQSMPFRLWEKPGMLATRLSELIAAMPSFHRIAVTMTGELCDCFSNKAEGVRAIVQAVNQAAEGTPVRFWTNRGMFADVSSVLAEPHQAAAANWLALAWHVARSFASIDPALLIDVGSTTTDLTYLSAGRPQPRGLTDPARLAHGELVYTAVRRTPVCAVLGMEVAAEFFATMLDVYLLLGLVPENPHDRDTADGRPATLPFAHARLARLRCADADEFPRAEARALAERALARQVEFVGWAVDAVLRERPTPRQVILIGSGAALGHAVCAVHPRLRDSDQTAITEWLGADLSMAACAYAVALLAAEEAP